mmetsp:Transcript_5446/g.14630  ORF Transcript_5446/g.14630 Transcript_5446/m.14630 type:complete len:350 (+) Transcript_5446:2076-3125(+)
MALAFAAGGVASAGHLRRRDLVCARARAVYASSGCGAGNGGGGGRRGRGGGGGRGAGGGGDSGDRESSSVDAVLARFGVAREALPDELLALGPEHLARYLAIAQNPVVKAVSAVWRSFRERVMADPDFPFKLLMEETLGLGLATAGFISARGRAVLDELDLFALDVSVGATLNFVLLFLLTPKLAVGARGVSAGATQARAAQLPANLFVAGDYSLWARLGGYVYKTALFGLCGVLGSGVGTSASKLIMQLKLACERDARKRAQLEAKQAALPGLAWNSAMWGAFMICSSSPRYQALAGVERLCFTALPPALAKLLCAAVRTANNVAGGAHWVRFSRSLSSRRAQRSKAA